MRTAFFIISIVLFTSCKTEETETTTRGRLHVYIPESIAPVMIDEVHEFLSLYKQNGAEIDHTIVPTESVARHFVYDTSRIAFLTRPLTQNEKDLAKKVSGDLNEILIAYDGIIIVVHPRNPIEQLSTTEIRKMLEGKFTKWDQFVSHKKMKGALSIYCHDSSDITGYLSQRMTKQQGIVGKFIRTNSDVQTLHEVEKDLYGLGIVALSWLDSVKSSAKVLNLGRTKEDTDTTFAPPVEAIGKYFSPDRAYIFLNYYPLKRAIYMYTRTQLDLAAGFATYVATTEGQKIILKHKLVPGTQHIKIRGPF